MTFLETGKAINKPRHNQGFTLIEMLVTMGVIAVLMGIGAAFTVKFTRGMEVESEASRIASWLQVVRDNAIISGNAATLRFTKEDDITVMRQSGRITVDCYHMEDNAGTFGNTFDATGADFKASLMGKALWLEAAESISITANPRWGFDTGFFVDAYVYVTELAAETELIKVDGQFILSLVPDGDAYVRLKGTIVLADASTVVLEAPDIPFEKNTWVKVGLGLLNDEALLFRDDVEIAAIDISSEPEEFNDISGDLELASGNPGFAGAVDELVLARWGAFTEQYLSANMRIKQLEDNLADANPFNDYYEVSYGPDGMLTGGSDMVITMEYGPDGKTIKSKTIIAGYTGTITK